MVFFLRAPVSSLARGVAEGGFDGFAFGHAVVVLLVGDLLFLSCYYITIFLIQRLGRVRSLSKRERILAVSHISKMRPEDELFQ